MIDPTPGPAAPAHPNAERTERTRSEAPRPRAAAPTGPPEADTTLDEQIERNERRVLAVVLAVAGAALVLVLLALLLGGPIAAAVVVVLGAAAVAWVVLAGEPLALRLAKAVPADEVAHAGLHNLTEGLCVTSGLPKPALFVVDDPGANAFAVGRTPQRAAVVVTSGLLEAVARIELEGLVAQELAHIRNGDTAVATIAVAVPFASGLLDAHREQLADLAAVELTRYPPGLAAALQKVRDHGTAVQARSFALAHLWLAPPDGSAGPAGAPALDERIAALHEL